MQLALLSDVHANLHALHAVLEDVDTQDPEALAFLGDAVGYNAYPQRCVELIEQRCDAAVIGNHDEAVLEGNDAWFNPAARAGVAYSREHLSTEAITYLESLPMQTQLHGVHLVHGSPRDPIREYVFPDARESTLREFIEHPNLADARVLALGHTHVPFARTVDDTLIVNAGSVGQPRDQDPRACWALLDTEALTVEHRRVDYDIDAAAEAVEDAGLPKILGDRLYEGR